MISKTQYPLLLCAIASIPTFAFAQDNSFYFGANLGTAAYSNQDKGLLLDDNNGLTWEIYTGIQTKKWLSFDLGYLFVSDVDVVNGGSFSVQGFDIAARPVYHINDVWSVYSKIGLVAYTAENTQLNDTDSSLASSTALGLEYKLNNNFYLGGKIQYLSQVGGEGTGEADLFSYTLGIRFVPSANRARPALILAPVIEEPVYVTAEETLLVYFDFDSSAVTEVEKLRLLAFIDQFNDKTINQITLSGFSDSLGPNKYNDKLSRLRAEQLRLLILDNVVISAADIVLDYYGELAPIADNATEQGRAINRRVNIVVNFEQLVTSNK